MFDSTTGTVRENVVIFTDGERIEAVLPAGKQSWMAVRSLISPVSLSLPACATAMYIFR